MGSLQSCGGLPKLQARPDAQPGTELPGTDEMNLSTVTDSGWHVILDCRSQIDTILKIEGLPRAAVVELHLLDRKLATVEVKNEERAQADLLPSGFQVNGVFTETTRCRHHGLQIDSFHKCDAEASEASQLEKISGENRWKNVADKLGAAMKAVEQLTPKKSGHSSPKARLLRMSETKEVLELLARAGQFDFNAAEVADHPEVSGRPFQCVGPRLLESSGLLQALDKELSEPNLGDKFRDRIMQFLGELDGLYSKDVPYHGAAHGIDVMSTMEYFVRTPLLKDKITHLDHFMALMAAAVHDVGHPGTNNLFHMKSMSPLAVRYNDRSILENYHASLAFETMQRKDSCNWVVLLSREFSADKGDSSVDLQQYVRKGLIGMVLATDMANHAKQVHQLKEYLPALADQKDSGGNKQEELEKKMALLEIVLHAVDISNPCKPREIMLTWTQRLSEECWAQGDLEQKLGLPMSPLCDRSAGLNTIPKGQIGFINFVIQPLYTTLVDLLPEAAEATEQMLSNKAFWQEKEKEKASYEQLFSK